MTEQNFYRIANTVMEKVCMIASCSIILAVVAGITLTAMGWY